MELTSLWRRSVSELSVTGLRASGEAEPERTDIPVSRGGCVIAGQHDRPGRRSELSRMASEGDTCEVRQFGAVHHGCVEPAVPVRGEVLCTSSLRFTARSWLLTWNGSVIRAGPA